MDVVGQVVGGGFGDILIRQKSGRRLEVGSLLVSEEDDSILILEVFGLEYGSQIQDGMRQMVSGVQLEREGDMRFYEGEFVHYVLARVKPLARISGGKVSIPKSLPTFFGRLRPISAGDLEFMKKGGDRIFVGRIRSGSEVLETEVWLPAEDVFSHHILIPATTGRGKSNLVKTILWHSLCSNRVGILVLDAHDEYYGRRGDGLSVHQRAGENLVYYTPDRPPPGAHSLSINLASILPEHFEGITDLSDAQSQALRVFHGRFKEEWLTRILTEDPAKRSEGARDKEIKTGTLVALQRKLKLMLDLEIVEGRQLVSRNGFFDVTKGATTARDIIGHIEQGKVVVMDTSRLGSEAELVAGNVIAAGLLDRYKQYKASGQLDRMPVASIVIEEAPRVIGEDVLSSKNSNVYATIAREGRKFKVGLVAVTQLSSAIPRAILANMNTKIILGNEMKQEREAVIASASQDLSDDDRNIASLDKGEAIITSIFVPFAMPIKIPLFDEIVKGASRAGDAPAKKPRVFG
ncbi:ATPase [Cenarchaeum symbiosum A]|uniref:ATPase n=1 Tax=Cenarchaeum symbiosum (strain A) TaxID=414004 RepID=A0RW72_CENSY|nr:ATPase [Cenarchaeum symbiosum A]